jgi:hypothetical protein
MSGASDELPMAHMDIAGADMTPDEKATGVSVKTIIQYLLNEDANLSGGKTASASSAVSKPAKAPVKAKAATATKVTKAAVAAPLKSKPKKGVPGKTKNSPKPAAKPKAKPAPKKKSK